MIGVHDTNQNSTVDIDLARDILHSHRKGFHIRLNTLTGKRGLEIDGGHEHQYTEKVVSVKTRAYDCETKQSARFELANSWMEAKRLTVRTYDCMNLHWSLRWDLNPRCGIPAYKTGAVDRAEPLRQETLCYYHIVWVVSRLFDITPVVDLDSILLRPHPHLELNLPILNLGVGDLRREKIAASVFPYAPVFILADDVESAVGFVDDVE